MPFDLGRGTTLVIVVAAVAATADRDGIQIGDDEPAEAFTRELVGGKR
ncbi:hypothetical protein ACWCPQ_14990 [Nocardia sp. NPDC001965]